MPEEKEEKKKKSSKNSPLVVVIAIVILALAAYFFLFRNKGGEITTPSEPSEMTKYTTLKAAVGAGIPMKCTYSVGGNEYEGFVKGKMWRGKIKSAEGKISEVIMKDNCMWTWSSEQTEGFKACFDETEADANMWDQDTVANIEYNCGPTAITESKFDPPEGIEFMDYSQMMMNIGR